MTSFTLATALATGLALAAGSVAFAQGTDARAAAALPGLTDLEKTTFACPKAALNAAAREVATHKSIGTYQFSYFNIVSGSHHAAYEVHFTSNYNQEPVLKYCVALYCQQGFDPTSTVTVMPIGESRAGGAGGAGRAGTTGTAGGAGTMAMAGHTANPCAPPKPAVRRRATR